MKNRPLYEITVLLIVSGAAFASSIAAPCLPFIVKNFNLNTSYSYYIVSIYLFGYLSGQIIHSLIAQFKGYRLTLLFGYSIYVFSCILQILAIKLNLINLFFCSRFLCSLGASAGLVCAFAMINDNHEMEFKNSKKLISKAFMSLTLFSYLAITIGGLITEYLKWDYVFYILIILSIIKLSLIYFHIPYKETQKTDINFLAAFKKIYTAFSNLKFISSSLMVTFTTTSTYLYNAVGSIISMNIFKLSSRNFGLLSLINLVCLLLGGWFSGKLMKRTSPIKTLSLGFLITLFPIIFISINYTKIFLLGSNGWLFFSLISMINIGLGVIYPSSTFLALNIFSCNSTASGAMNFIKIGVPALTISILSQLELDLVKSYQYSMLTASLIAMMCLIYLNITWKR